MWNKTRIARERDGLVLAGFGMGLSPTSYGPVLPSATAPWQRAQVSTREGLHARLASRSRGPSRRLLWGSTKSCQWPLSKA